MAEDDSTKALLERLCALQEEQLALTRQSLERHEQRAQRQEKSQELWERQLAEHQDYLKAHRQEVERHERLTNIRGAIILAIWVIVAVVLLISHFR
jgi:methionyl-tRNA formyltransferase